MISIVLFCNTRFMHCDCHPDHSWVSLFIPPPVTLCCMSVLCNKETHNPPGHLRHVETTVAWSCISLRTAVTCHTHMDMIYTHTELMWLSVLFSFVQVQEQVWPGKLAINCKAQTSLNKKRCHFCTADRCRLFMMLHKEWKRKHK